MRFHARLLVLACAGAPPKRASELQLLATHILDASVGARVPSAIRAA